MLSLFPGLLFLGPLATTLLRLSAALAFFYIAWRLGMERVEITHEKLPILGHSPKWANLLYALFVFAIAIFLFIGLFTQAAAIGGAVIAIEHAFLARHYRRVVPLSRAANIFLLVICLSLIFSGAGAFGFDLPL